MGSIIRTAANNVGASGVFSSSAFNNASLNSVTSLPTTVDGKLKLISSQTASASSSISFTSGIDSTYKLYCFKFFDIHPATNDTNLKFGVSTDGGSNYGVTATSSCFRAGHNEADDNAFVGANSGAANAQETQDIYLTQGIGNLDDECASGELYIFNPSSTTFVKHFIGNINMCEHADQSLIFHIAGYFNTTSAINAIIFRQSSGNIDNGTIAMYGVS